MTDTDKLKRLAEAATAGDLDTVPNPPNEYGGHSTGRFECPACSGQGEVEGATYCNFDHKALGVQFFGIGNEFQNYEAYFRAANPKVILALIAESERLKEAGVHYLRRAWSAEAKSHEAVALLREWDRVGIDGTGNNNLEDSTEAFLARIDSSK